MQTTEYSGDCLQYHMDLLGKGEVVLTFTELFVECHRPIANSTDGQQLFNAMVTIHRAVHGPTRNSSFNGDCL